MNVLFFIFLYYAASEILPNFIQNSQDIFRVLALKGIRGIPIAGQHRTHAYKEVKSRFSDKNYLPATFSFRLYDRMPKSVSIATSRVRNRIYIYVYKWCFSIISIKIYWRYAIVNVSSYAIRTISCWKVDALPFLLPNQRTQESAKWRTKDVKAQSVLRLAQDILKLHNETQINRDLTPDEEKRYMVCGWIKTNGSCYMWHNRLLFFAWGFWMRWKRTTTIFAFVSDQALVVFWNKYV